MCCAEFHKRHQRRYSPRERQLCAVLVVGFNSSQFSPPSLILILDIPPSAAAAAATKKKKKKH
jgi:hypothetical protein